MRIVDVFVGVWDFCGVSCWFFLAVSVMPMLRSLPPWSVKRVDVEVSAWNKRDGRQILFLTEKTPMAKGKTRNKLLSIQ